MPVGIDDQNRILYGHARVAAAARLVWTSVPAIQVSDPSEAEKRAFFLADNKFSEQGRWDDALLAENFQILETLEPEFALEDTGFSVPEIGHFLGLAILDDEAGLDDNFPDPAGPLVCQQGDLWQLRDHKLYCGDALDHYHKTGWERGKQVTGEW